MYPVKYLGDVIKIDGIHFYGCSFTAGQELLDKEFDPVIEYCDTPESRVIQLEKKSRLEKQMAWPAHMCSDLQITNCYNKSEPGNSMDNMKSQFYNDIIHNRIKESELCIFGTTGYFREILFHPIEDWVDIDQMKECLPSERGKSFSRVVADHLERIDQSEKAFEYYRYKFPYVLFFHYMNALKDILYTAKIHNVPILLVDCLHPTSVSDFNDLYQKKSPMFDHVEYQYTDNLVFIEKIINTHKITDRVFGPYYNKDPMPRGHPNEQAHIEWGRYLASVLRP